MGDQAAPLDGVEAVVLVGGVGSRLRPLTLSVPKPMLPAAGVPVLTHLLSRIRAAGIRHVVLGTSYRAEVFTGHFGDGRALGLTLDYITEAEPLGTGGGIRNVADALSEPDVLVFNGDVLSGVDLAGVLGTHRAAAADVTLHLVRVPDPRAFGCVPTDADGLGRCRWRRFEINVTSPAVPCRMALHHWRATPQTHSQLSRAMRRRPLMSRARCR